MMMFAGVGSLERVAQLADRLSWVVVHSDDCALADCGCPRTARPEAERDALLLLYACMNVDLDARFAARPGTVETLAVRSIDSRPCDPIEPDPNPVCITEDDLT